MIVKIKEKFSNRPKLLEFISNSFWSVVGTAISKVLLLLIWVLIARMLEPALYGEFSIIRNTTLLFAEFVGFSLSIAATKFIAESLNDKHKLKLLIDNLLILCFALGVILMGLFLYFSDYISVNMMKAPQLTQYIAITSLVLLVSTFNHCQLGILRGLGEFKLIAKLNLLQILTSFPVFVILTYFYGLMGAVIGYVFHNTILCIITQYFMGRKIRSIGVDYKLSLKLDLSFIKKISVYVLPYFISVFIGYFANWYNEIQLVSYGDDGFKHMGEYSAISTIQNMVISSIIVLCVPFVSMMSKYKASGDRSIEKYNYTAPLFLSLICSLFFIIVPESFSLIYGEGYANQKMYLAVSFMMAFTPIIVFKQALARSIAVYEKQNILLIDNILYCAIIIFSYSRLIHYGVNGIIMSLFIANLFSLVVFTPIYIKVKLFPSKILLDKSMLIMCIGYLIVIMMSYIFKDNLLIRLISCALLYISIIVTILIYIKRKINTAHNI